jgi:Ca2+-binding EF-hand superfamily protein
MGKQISAIAYDDELRSINEKGLSVKQLELVKEVFHSVSKSTSDYINANSLKCLLGLPLKETQKVMEYCDLEEDGFDEYDFVCMVSLFTQAETDEKLASIFKIFDDDSSQLIAGNELER